MSKRRNVLIGLGGMVALAGCSGDTDEEPEQNDEVDRSNIDTAEDAVVGAISYRADEVTAEYSYHAGDYEKQPETVTFQSDSEIFHEFDPTNDEPQRHIMEPAEIADDPDNALETLPTTQIVVQFDDGSSTVIAERSGSTEDENSVFLNANVYVENYSNGHAIVTATIIDGDRIRIQSDEGYEEFLEESGDSVQIPIEDGYAEPNNGVYTDKITFEAVIEADGLEQTFWTFEAGAIPADIDLRDDALDDNMHHMNIHLSNYDELTVQVENGQIDSTGDGEYDTTQTTVTEPSELAIDTSNDNVTVSVTTQYDGNTIQVYYNDEI